MTVQTADSLLSLDSEKKLRSPCWARRSPELPRDICGQPRPGCTLWQTVCMARGAGGLWRSRISDPGWRQFLR